MGGSVPKHLHCKAQTVIASRVATWQSTLQAMQRRDSVAIHSNKKRFFSRTSALEVKGIVALGVIFAGYMLVARMYANRSAKVMEATVHNGIERCLINCSHTEQIVEEMVQRYIAGTGPKRKLGAWHRFKIRNNRPAQQ